MKFVRASLVLLLSVCCPALLLSGEKPWLVVNEDNARYFLQDADRMNRAALEAHVDGLARGHVTHFFMCVNGQCANFDSKTMEPVWENAAADDRWAANAKRLRDAGIDPYAVWVARCRAKGVSPWISMRMNETAFGTDPKRFRASRFAQNRRDLWRTPGGDPASWGTCGLDYANREVWQRAFRQTVEILERWDADGIELDWMRGPAQALRPWHERGDAHFLTDFVAAVRGEANRLAARRGHPVKVAVRVPRAPFDAAYFGMDAVSWAEKGLVDVIVASGGACSDAAIPVAHWLERLKSVPAVMFLPALDSAYLAVGARASAPMTVAHYRGFADTFYRGGAKGLYLGNAQDDASAFDTVCAEGLAPETIAAKPQRKVETRPLFPDCVFDAPKDVPPLLKTFDGREVKTLADWEKVRAPELRDCLLSRMYGRRPAAAERPDVRFEAAEPDCAMMEGKAVRKRIRCTYRGPYGESNFVFTAFIPQQERPAPAFVLICNRDPKANLDPTRAVKSGFWPAEEIVARGYAAIAFFNGDITKDARWDFANGVFACYEKPWERTGESWGILSAWAWGASRVMDWIETERSLDARHVAVVGHSRGGKTALVAGLMDPRFALVCSNDSGCGGAKLNHMLLPGAERFDMLIDAISCWFCPNFGALRYRDATVNFDQHMLVALLAPRLVAIGSALDDAWAGPEGEFETGRYASPAWKLYGREGLVADAFPGPLNPKQDGSISYHERTGEHNLTPYDWARYMDFADRHGWRK